jgi:hypothetical protein
MTKQIRKLYRERATIYGVKPVKRNGATEVQQVTIAENVPCHFSNQGLNPSDPGQYGTDAYDGTIYMDNGYDVPAGATIDVTDSNGYTTRYKRASKGYTPYKSHMEIAVVRDEKAKEAATNG